MTKSKTTKKALFASAMSLILCFAMLLGTTYAWFTDSVTSAGNKIMSGTLDVALLMHNGSEYEDISESQKPIFGAGSIAQDNNAETLWEPGKTQVAYLAIENKGNLALKYKVALEVINVSKDLYEVMYYTITPDAQPSTVIDWNKVDGKAVVEGTNIPTADVALEPGATHYFALSIHMDEMAGNEYQDGEVDFDLTVLATQLTYEEDSFDDQYDADAEYPFYGDTWDGTTDFGVFALNAAWLDDEGNLDTAAFSAEEYEPSDVLIINTAEELAAFQKLVNAGEFFEGKTVKLGKDIDLGGTLFTPIGDGSNTGFLGTFDGDGHTIFNLTQDCNAKYVGFFGCVEDATIKNLTFDNALIENDGRGYAAVVASCGKSTTFENITLKDCDVRNYNHNTAGIIGWLYGDQESVFNGINIDATNTIASWWGSYDTRVGGIVGAMNTTATNTVTIKNSTIACRLDVYNDVCSNYQWYNYRMAGMLVADVRDNVTVDGRTQANPVRVTCENVTVVFGDWANYHYCEDADYGIPSYAGEGEYKFNRVEAGAGYGGIDLSACDHDANEQHNVLIEFDFLFGARDGKGVYGVSSHDGVTVVK